MASGRVLFALTSHSRLGSTGKPTGFHLGEAALPWAVLRTAGYDVDFVSPAGGAPAAVGVNDADPHQFALLNDPVARTALAYTHRPRDVVPDRYKAVYFVGGHGAMWDFRGHPELQDLASSVYEAGGVVSAICHGPAALVDLKLSNGEYLVAGKGVTAFSNVDEAARGLADTMPFALQTALEERGGRYTCAPDKVAHVVVSERLVTGQNPASTADLADAVVELIGA